MTMQLIYEVFRITKSYRCPHRRFQSSTVTQMTKVAHPFDKARLEALLNRRFFYAPAFEIYGGASCSIPFCHRHHHHHHLHLTFPPFFRCCWFI